MGCRRCLTLFVRLLPRHFPLLQILQMTETCSHLASILNVTELVATLKAGIDGHAASSDLSWITPAAIYHYPTIQQLTTVLGNFLNKKNVADEQDPETRATRMEELLKTYTQDLPKRSEHDFSNPASGVTIALTGSTGSLGRSILASLLKNSKSHECSV